MSEKTEIKVSYDLSDEVEMPYLAYRERKLCFTLFECMLLGVKPSSAALLKDALSILIIRCIIPQS